MILCMISYVMSCRKQDCIVVLAPYPNNPNPVESFNIKTDFDLTGDGLVWYARPQHIRIAIGYHGYCCYRQR